MIHSANPTVNRREERLLRERLAAMDMKVTALVEVVAKAAAFTDHEVAEVGRMMVEGRIRLPSHTRLTVTTTVEDVRNTLFNTTTEVITHTADQLQTKHLRPLTVLEALEAGLIRRVERGFGAQHLWVWSEVAYERLASAAD